MQHKTTQLNSRPCCHAHVDGSVTPFQLVGGQAEPFLTPKANERNPIGESNICLLLPLSAFPFPLSYILPQGCMHGLSRKKKK